MDRTLRVSITAMRHARWAITKWMELYEFLSPPCAMLIINKLINVLCETSIGTLDNYRIDRSLRIFITALRHARWAITKWMELYEFPSPPCAMLIINKARWAITKWMELYEFPSPPCAMLIINKLINALCVKTSIGTLDNYRIDRSLRIFITALRPARWAITKWMELYEFLSPPCAMLIINKLINVLCVKTSIGTLDNYRMDKTLRICIIAMRHASLICLNAVHVHYVHPPPTATLQACLFRNTMMLYPRNHVDGGGVKSGSRSCASRATTRPHQGNGLSEASSMWRI
ncbi:hypothetical protein EVAR_26953_1 [Eumeta japonica]|uniref:Uncharacterized protein n=1 Tax=Eumeta variegata TaxID=151549 RepID=A0A4C1VLI7_EUMVA|nr:hypothetical protein EVAR_26953_1 [Eumeta japonica]